MKATAFAMLFVGITPTGASAETERLIQELKNGNAGARARAAEALGALGPKAKDAVPALVEAMMDKDAHVRRRAGNALGFIRSSPEVTAPALIKALKDPDEGQMGEASVAQIAAFALGRFGADAAPAIPALMETMKSGHADTRRASIHALGSLGKQNAKVVKAIVGVLKNDPDFSLRAAAARSVGKIGPNAKDAIPALWEMLRLPIEVEIPGGQDSVTAARCESALALGDMAAAAKELVPEMAKMIPDKTVPISVRRCIVQALGKIGPDAKEGVPALVGALKADGGGMQDPAIKSLAKIGRPAIPAVVGLLENGKGEERCEALHVLRLMGPEARGALLAVEKACKDADSTVANQARVALKSIRGEK